VACAVTSSRSSWPRATAEDNGYYLAPHGDRIPDGLLALMIHEDAATHEQPQQRRIR
jgi:hypothetical protein